MPTTRPARHQDLDLCELLARRDPFRHAGAEPLLVPLGEHHAPLGEVLAGLPSWAAAGDLEAAS